MKISDSIIYVGVNDHNVDLFEGQYKVPNGMSYNSYIILDEKTAVMDSVDINFGDEWLNNIEKALNGKAPDYIIIQHMEPDHSASLGKFLDKYTETIVVSSQKAFAMINAFFKTDYADRRIIVNEGDTLDLGKHKLTFYTAPMVHWPEVIVTYDNLDKVLFSADGFGKFGALDVEETWADEARRYYIGIVGKYGIPVQTLLKKASTLDIEKICPLHGPVLTENLGYYIDLYDKWSSYSVETDGVVIAYSSVYGNTEKAVFELAESLKENGVKEVMMYDLARCDMAQAVADAFRYGKLVLASITYNGDVFPFMRTYISALTERNFQKRTVAFIENGSWACTASKTMKTMLEKSQNITFAEATVTIKSSPDSNTSIQIKTLAEELA